MEIWSRYNAMQTTTLDRQDFAKWTSLQEKSSKVSLESPFIVMLSGIEERIVIWIKYFNGNQSTRDLFALYSFCFMSISKTVVQFTWQFRFEMLFLLSESQSKRGEVLGGSFPKYALRSVHVQSWRDVQLDAHDDHDGLHEVYEEYFHGMQWLREEDGQKTKMRTTYATQVSTLWERDDESQSRMEENRSRNFLSFKNQMNVKGIRTRLSRTNSAKWAATKTTGNPRVSVEVLLEFASQWHHRLYTPRTTLILRDFVHFTDEK